MAIYQLTASGVIKSITPSRSILVVHAISLAGLSRNLRGCSIVLVDAPFAAQVRTAACHVGGGIQADHRRAYHRCHVRRSRIGCDSNIVARCRVASSSSSVSLPIKFVTTLFHVSDDLLSRLLVQFHCGHPPQHAHAERCCRMIRHLSIVFRAPVALRMAGARADNQRRVDDQGWRDWHRSVQPQVKAHPIAARDYGHQSIPQIRTGHPAHADFCVAQFSDWSPTIAITCTCARSKPSFIFAGIIHAIRLARNASCMCSSTSKLRPRSCWRNCM